MRAISRTLSVRGAAWVLLALSLGATALICHQAWRSEQDRRHLQFKGEATVLSTAIERRLVHYRRVLMGVHGLFAASDNVERNEFHAYVDDLDIAHAYPGALALGYVERVRREDLEAFREKLAQDWPELDRAPDIWPLEPRSEYAVIRFVEPVARNWTEVGYDIHSESRKWSAAKLSRDAGSASLTPRIEFSWAPDQVATMLFEPVYSKQGDPGTPAQREAELVGWVYAAFIVEDMLEGVREDAIHKNAHSNSLHYEIFDGPEPENTDLVHHSAAYRDVPGGFPPETWTLNVFDRPWTVRIHAPKLPVAGRQVLPVGILAGGGLCMSLLIFGVAHSMATSKRRAYSIAREMTSELRHKERALRASEERLAMVIKGSNDGIWDWDLRTNEVYFSPRWKSMLGYEEHEIENHFRAWRALVHPDDRERALKVVEHYFQGKTDHYKLEHRLRHKDGSYRWILSRGVASRDADGSPVRMAGSHIDLTNLKAAERRMRKSNRELADKKEELQRTLNELRASHDELEKTQLELIQAAKFESVGTLAAGVAHEVKNPLQIIVMGLDFLGDKVGDTTGATGLVLEDMRDAAMRANSITKELLQFSAPTSFEPKPTDLEKVVERSLRLIHAEITKYGVTVVKRFADTLPTVSIDVPQIEQVLINLMTNSLQAMGPSGELTLTIASGSPYALLPQGARLPSSMEEAGDLVTLKIHDNGPGIDPDLIPRIFDPFFTTKPVGVGTGLGLSIVKRIIDLHGGIIHFQNPPDGGLEVTLAFATAEETEVPAVATKTLKTTSV